MCGICGVVSSETLGSSHTGLLKSMCLTLYHRGPDDEGYYIDQNAGLGVRRLSIIDLVTGKQPISNEDRSIWVVFNGEIYNYRTIRAQLEARGHVFATQSDTEVIVHAYEQYDQECLHLFNGMFSFAIWDANRQRLLIARDRLGIKPLYYWTNNNQIIFGSELKSLLANPSIPRDIDPIALDYFLTLEYIPNPHTIIKNIHKLPPGHYLLFQDGSLRIEPYWDIEPRKLPRNELDCEEALMDLIKDSVQMRLVSDVPLGAFLSGGIDSSTVVAFMTKVSNSPVRTFSIGFEEDGSFVGF